MSSFNHDWKKLLTETFDIQVTPKASSNRIKAEIVEGALRIKVYVTAPPEDGKANKATLQLLSEELGVARSSLSIISGVHSRKKVIRITKSAT